MTRRNAEAARILRLFGAGGAEAEQIADRGHRPHPGLLCRLPPGRRTGGKKPWTRAWPSPRSKSENAIDRIKGVAQHPRFMERVPADAEFSFTVSLKKLDIDQDDALEDLLLMGLKLLSLDALGGSGSRGYGRIEFEFDDSEIKKRFDAVQPFSQEA
jgi:CRISPR-associated protein Csm3